MSLLCATAAAGGPASGLLDIGPRQLERRFQLGGGQAGAPLRTLLADAHPDVPGWPLAWGRTLRPAQPSFTPDAVPLRLPACARGLLSALRLHGAGV